MTNVKAAAEKQATLDKLKAAEKRADNTPLPEAKTEKNKDQAQANAMNAAVAADVKAQEVDNEKEAAATKTELSASQDDDKIDKDIPATKDGITTAMAMEDEIVRRADILFKQKIAEHQASPNVGPAPSDKVLDHKRICLNVSASILGILGLRDKLPDDRVGLNIFFDMLKKVLIKTSTAALTPAKFEAKKDKVSFPKLIISGGSLRENQIYTNELKGHLMNLITAADDFSPKWRDLWHGYAKKVLKSLG